MNLKNGEKVKYNMRAFDYSLLAIILIGIAWFSYLATLDLTN